MKPSKSDIISAELEFFFIYYDSVFCAESEVVPRVEERFLDSGFIQTSVVDAFDFVVNVTNEVVISVSVRISSRDVPLGQAFVTIPSPFGDEGGEFLALFIQCY